MEVATTNKFDAVKYKQTTFEQWQSAAEAWYRWTPAINRWLGKATEELFDLANLTLGEKVLDIAAGAGEQTTFAARKVGPTGYVLATDISPNILEFANMMARQVDLKNIETKVMDGENLTLPDETFDFVFSRVGLIYFPDQQKALKETWRVLKPGGRIGAIVYSTADKNEFFSIPVSIIRKRANLPPPVSGQPGPFSLGAPGVIQDAFEEAGFNNIKTKLISAPVIMSSAKECVQFEKESFGALHQMLSSLSESAKNSVWNEIEEALSAFEVGGSFVGPCEMIIAVGEKLQANH
ncbi:class I SAM-dependent methyltransferase [Chryseolinea sp. H1M3-3]|uniref:class I SAM-dependent methyltransferase n=1 Tax=Chryseolinea sp. H1M3-3 TaxID=3034144 RepID=UPI0023EB61E1|nr:class I SAM-dependent methyltransferase [Chryseolinea sp. H1M3-3]